MTNFWQGKRIRLRAVEPADAGVFHRWGGESETGRDVDFLWPPGSLVRVQQWAHKTAADEPLNDLYSLVIEDSEGQAAGIINSHTVDRRVGTFRYGVAVREEFRGRGYAAEAVCLLLRYFFGELRYQKVTVEVYSYNTASQRLHEKLGFQLEGRLRRLVYTGGRHYDALYYGMTAEEFWERYGREPSL